MPVSDEIITAAQDLLGHTFSDTSLLARALTHASIADSRVQSNERLEFLGDAVLGLMVCEYLYRAYPDLLEGEMTKIKSDAVSRRKCARIADEMGLTDLLVIGKGMRSRSSLPPSLAAAALESVLGALYIDAGYEQSREFLEPYLKPIIERAARSGHQQNFKSVLQQHAQQAGGSPPCYTLLDEQGPDHDKAFLVAVDLDGQRFGPCWARSKKAAEQQAARTALGDLGLIVEDDQGQPVYVPSLDEEDESREVDEDELLVDGAG